MSAATPRATAPGTLGVVRPRVDRREHLLGDARRPRYGEAIGDGVDVAAVDRGPLAVDGHQVLVRPLAPWRVRVGDEAAHG